MRRKTIETARKADRIELSERDSLRVLELLAAAQRFKARSLVEKM